MQGTQIDYFGLVAVSGNDTKVELKSSSLSPAQSDATAMNRRGDMIAHNEYHKTIAPQCVYTVIGTYDLSALSLGKKYTYTVNSVERYFALTSVSVSTANGSALPELTLKAEEVPSAYDDDGDFALQPLPAISVTATFAAQKLAFASAPISSGDGDITKSDWSATASFAEAAGSTGERIAAAIHGTKYDQKCDYVMTLAANAAPVITPPTGYFISSPATLDESPTDFASGSFSIAKYDVRSS